MKFGYGRDGVPDLVRRLFDGDRRAWWARKLSRIKPTPTAQWLALALVADDVDETSFFALAAQMKLLRDHVGPPEVVFPPPIRKALGLPRRVNLPLRYLEAACREAVQGHDQFSSADAGVAE